MGNNDSFQTLREIVIARTDAIAGQVNKMEVHVDEIKKATIESYIYQGTHYDRCPNTAICKQVKLIKWFIVFIGSLMAAFQGVQTFYNNDRTIEEVNKLLLQYNITTEPVNLRSGKLEIEIPTTDTQEEKQTKVDAFYKAEIKSMNK